MTFFLLAVLVLILIAVILISVLVVVLIIVLVAVVVLVIHTILPSFLRFAVFRYSSISGFSGLILCFEEKACQKTGKNSRSNSTSSSF